MGRVSPKIIKAQKGDMFFGGIALIYFFIEFSISWIMRWTIEVNDQVHDKNEFPTLRRKFHTKFWSKLLHKDQDNKIIGQEIIDQI